MYTTEVIQRKQTTLSMRTYTITSYIATAYSQAMTTQLSQVSVTTPMI